MVLQILITNSIGAKFSAYYYMAIMIASLLYVIPMATSQSLFTEGSYNEKDLRLHVKKATIKIISLILIPAIIVIFLFGKYILLAFGKEYSSEGVIFLQILAISGIFVNKPKRGGVLIVKILFILRDILSNCPIVRKLIGFFWKKQK